MTTYYERNRERLLARQKEAYHANKETILARQKEAYHADKEKFKVRNKASDVKRLYGITIDEINNLVQKQQNRCGICKIEMDAESHKRHSRVIDHDHETGKIRGLLCNKCNVSLGAFGDSLEKLQAAVDYLRNSI